MTSLATYQKLFFEGLMPDAAPQAQHAAAAMLDVSSAFSGHSRLDVYRDMYRLRLVEALRIDFEQTHKALGDAAFSEVATRYIVAHPPRTASLNHVGALFAPFLESVRVARRDLCDLAHLEWARVQAAHKPMLSPARFEDWLAMGPVRGAAAHFILSPSVVVLHLRQSACALWRALEHDETQPVQSDDLAYVAVWRDGPVVAHRPLQDRDAQALLVLANGGNFVALCDLFVNEDEPAQRVAHKMQQFFKAGFVVAIGEDT